MPTLEWWQRPCKNGTIEWKLDTKLQGGEKRPRILEGRGRFWAYSITGYSAAFLTLEAAKRWIENHPKLDGRGRSMPAKRDLEAKNAHRRQANAAASPARPAPGSSTPPWPPSQPAPPAPARPPRPTPAASPAAAQHSPPSAAAAATPATRAQPGQPLITYPSP